jgi:hypothetical protein
MAVRCARSGCSCDRVSGAALGFAAEAAWCLLAKTVAELTSQQDGVIRQQVIEHLIRQIMHYDAEFRREEATSAVGSSVKR